MKIIDNSTAIQPLRATDIDHTNGRTSYAGYPAWLASFNAAPNGKSGRLSVSIAGMAPESSCGANIPIRFYGLNTVFENTCVNIAFLNTVENNLFGGGKKSMY